MDQFPCRASWQRRKGSGGSSCAIRPMLARTSQREKVAGGRPSFLAISAPLSRRLSRGRSASETSRSGRRPTTRAGAIAHGSTEGGGLRSGFNAGDDPLSTVNRGAGPIVGIVHPAKSSTGVWRLQPNPVLSEQPHENSLLRQFRPGARRD
jgi:hypothetical protein